MTALAIIHKQAILQRLQAGEHGVSIAHSLNITKSALSHALADDPEYQAAIEDGLDVRMIQREQEVEQSTDMFNLARAKELLRHSEFRASVECPKRWGKNADVQVMVAPVFNVIVSNPSPTYTYDSATDQTQGGLSVQGQG